MMRSLSCLQTLGTKYAVTHCHIPEELIPHQQRYGNLKARQF